MLFRSHGISYFFLSLIFEMGISQIGDQSIEETVLIVSSSERDKFDQRSEKSALAKVGALFSVCVKLLMISIENEKIVVEYMWQKIEYTYD